MGNIMYGSGSDVFTNYEILCQMKCQDEVPVTKYKSRKTGLITWICEMEMPMVKGQFTFATESHDDDGLPNALKHLVLMGSESYPYKKVLNQLANRCFASPVDSTTYIDCTTYNVCTIGSEGFLNLLPVYLDHLLNPTLTDEAFLTEVHHINGEGKDGGVVYSKMESYENNGGRICNLEVVRAIYPGKTGYKSEIGGRLKNVREITNEKVREYHRQFYRPENLCIVIVGKINASDVFKVLSPIEEKIILKGPLPAFTRPWQDPIPPLAESVEKTIFYPSDDNEYGIVTVAWRGPHVNKIEECIALEFLLDYLQNTSASPLQKEFIETEEPYCRKVSASLIENSHTFISVRFENVTKEHLYNIKSRLLEILRKLATNDEEFDMKRISSIIHNVKLDTFTDIAKSRNFKLFGAIVADFLYGKTMEDLKQRMQSTHFYDELIKKDAQFWKNLLKKYFLVENFVTIIGESSVELKEKLAEEEEMRISKQREHLGEEGLKLKEESLEAAKNITEVKLPKELLLSVPIPSCESIKLFHIKRMSNYKDDSTYDEILKDMPCAFHFDDDANIKFVIMRVMLDSSNIPSKLCYYIPLFLDMIMKLPIDRNGKLIPHEEVIAELDADTTYASGSLGLSETFIFSLGSYAQIVSLCLEVEEDKYQKGIQWLHELLFKTKFTADRIRDTITNLLTRITYLKQDASLMGYTVENNILYIENSNYSYCNILKQNTFLKKLQSTLEKSPNEVINDLEELRSKLTQPENMLIHVSANLKYLGENSLSFWKNFLENPQQKPFTRQKILDRTEYLLPLQSSVSRSCIVGIKTDDLPHMFRVTRCMDSCKHPDYPALLILISYLTQVEGPLWRMLKDMGYDKFTFSLGEDCGLLTLNLNICDKLVNVYEEMKKCVEDLLSGRGRWDQSQLEAAASRSIYINSITQERSPVILFFQSLTYYYNEVDLDFVRETLFKRVFEVTIEDLQNVGTKYLLPLFDPTTSTCIICCNASRVEEFVSAFNELDRSVNIITDLDNCAYAQLDDENS